MIQSNASLSRRSLVLAALLLSLAAPLAARASGKASTSSETTYSMKLRGESLELQSAPVDGVQATILVTDVRSEMKKLKSAKTHLVAIRFNDVKTGKTIDRGNAALYFSNDHNAVGLFDPMKNENGIFVAGLLIISKGEQEIIIASKLKDGRNRDFHFRFVTS